ncbi:ATP-binding protein [Adhaeribacter sp. BT258]|uniref:ATP-binding protein n=1 Tax=Adhaeribacter terrigena TaxID=2793070 RepID=A0ABS1C3A0_9BACT|nr:ATP-binding protein [Adhaeribacter terrigena]MBK0403113.1 ATP-binding protein [Adhaeribacter terrigena]
MNELQLLISGGESDTLDFKKRIQQPDRIARTLASFANTRGGIILVGVMDNGEVTGIDPEEEIYTLQQAADYYCEPPVNIFFKELENEDGKTVLKVIIPESVEKPHLVKVKEGDWRSYVRVKDETVLSSNMAGKILKNELTQKAPLPLDSQEIALMDFLKANRRITQKQFMKLVNISHPRAYRILIRMVLAGAIRLHQAEPEDYYTLA